MIYASADYDGLELRTVAQACLLLLGESRLAAALNAGIDAHLVVAAQMLGIAYEEALNHQDDESHCTLPAYEGQTWKHVIGEARQAGKVANFGFGGGLGAKKLVGFARKQYGVRLTFERAKTLKKNWLGSWPEFNRYFARSKYLSETGAPVVHLFSGRVRGRCTFTQHCNSPFQGLGADATGSAAFLISKYQYTQQPCMACSGSSNGCQWCRPCHGPGISPMYGARMVNYVHDDFINETCEAWGHEVAHELVRLMVAGAAPYLPDVPATAKPLLSRYWSKDAKQTWKDSTYPDGTAYRRLVAWP